MTLGMCSLRGWGSARNLCRPCKFQVVESRHPSPQRTESVGLHGGSREIGEHRLGIVEKKKKSVQRGDGEMLEPRAGLGI